MKFQCYTIFTSNATTYPIGVHYALPVNIGSRQKGYRGTNLFTDLFKISATKKKVLKLTPRDGSRSQLAGTEES